MCPRTKEAVDALKAINPVILVEGEIGDIGTGSEIHGTGQIHTPSDLHVAQGEHVVIVRKAGFKNWERTE